MDQMLDLVVSPNLSQWHWKDEAELEMEVARGLLTRAEAVAVRAEGDRVVHMLEERATSFSDGWESWRPDPAWRVPGLIEGWSEVD